MDLAQRVLSRRAEILALAQARGARNLRLVGSLARGDCTERSDVDLLVELEPGTSLLDIGALIVELRALLGCPVEILTVPGLRAGTEERLLAEAVSL
ncbi:MAG: nucleotidyltransferase domain-containing protein [Candidatus Wallbacteria bacterium]|nr:nucleotidyltransferase domain-containing protein [Candidatus Wallbacteria bacterium]